MAARVGPAAAALTRFEKDFEKSFGEGSLIVGDTGRPYTLVSTGSIDLDRKLGGGIIVGRIHEWEGPGNVFKTTMAMELAANHQRMFPNRMVGWIDMERTFDDRWAQLHGVNLDRRVFRRTKPDNAEDVSDMAKKFVHSGLCSLIVIDSIGGMIGKQEMEKDADEAAVATVARIVTRMVKQQAVLCDRHQTTLLVINQPRANISGGPRAGTTRGGGFALKQVSSQMLKFRQTATMPYSVGKGEDLAEVGYEIAVKVDRNKIAPKGRTALVTVFIQSTAQFGPLGIDRATEAFQLGSRLGVIEKVGKGHYYQLSGLDKTNGEDKTIAALREHPELIEEIRVKILAMTADEVAATLGAPDEDLSQESDGEQEAEVDSNEFPTGGRARAEMDLDPDALAIAHAAARAAVS